MFNNKIIFITGATGSFGNAFLKVLTKKYKPKKVIVYSRDELKQFELKQKFNQRFMRYFLGDVRDFERLCQAMEGVDFVIHAAALKQVPAAEYNPFEFIKTNIHGAQNVVNAALNNNVDKVIALSTDKAVNPVNLYGATKLASDKLFIAANNMVGNNRTKLSVVRYGNVVGSRGSVLPFFKKLIESKNYTLPITDVKMSRFWITLNESVNFVFKGFQRMKGGEILIPKIPSIRIVDLAKSLDDRVRIKVIGIRPGEKIHESLCSSEESDYLLEFKDHFSLAPQSLINFKISNYKKNSLNEVGKKVPKDYSYTSQNNPDFLSLKQIRKLNLV
jgi:UDP-N-acetylglucosamine 4,6-dehydratase